MFRFCDLETELPNIINKISSRLCCQIYSDGQITQHKPFPM